LEENLPLDSEVMSPSAAQRDRGKPLKHAYHLVDKKPFSTSNITALEYWNEWKCGVNSNPSLELLEIKGTEWKSDKNKHFKREDGTFGIAIKVVWSKQRPIYTAIADLMEHEQMPMSAAVQVVQSIFDEQKYKKSGEPDLNECKPFLVTLAHTSQPMPPFASNIVI
jgi:hypothetical protein